MFNLKNKSEIFCVLASLILNENNIAISEINLKKIFNASRVKTEDYWPLIFTKLMHTVDINEFVGVARKKDLQKEEKTETEKKKTTEASPAETKDISKSKDSDEDMGFGLFD